MMRADIDTLPEPMIDPADGFTPSSNGHAHPDGWISRENYDRIQKRKISDAEWAEQLRSQQEHDQRKAETPTIDGDFQYHALTEAESGRMLANLIRARARFNVTSAKWMFHDRKRFVQDDSGKVEAYAKALARKTSELMLTPPGDTTTKEARQFFKTSNSARGVSSIMRMTQFEPGIPAQLVDFDRDPFLFNTLTGTVDLPGLPHVVLLL